MSEKKSITIMHVADYLPPFHDHIGGAEKAAWDFSRLTHEYNNLRSVYLTSHPVKGKERQNNVSVLTRRAEDFLPEKIGKYIQAAKWYSWQRDPFALKDTKKAFLKFKPDIVHVYNCPFLTLGVIDALKSISNVPVCFSIFDYWVFCPLATLWNIESGVCSKASGTHCLGCLPKKLVFLQKLLLSRRAKVIKKTLDLIDRFLVLSEHSAGVLEKFGIERKRISIVHLPVKLPDIAADRNENSDSILFVGWRQHRKGLHVLLKALAILHKTKNNVKLNIIGGTVKFGTEYEKKIKSLIRELGLKGIVNLLGRVSDERLNEEIAKASLIAVPEQWENMSPVIVLDALSKGKAVVASRIGGIPEFIEHGKEGLLAKADDPNDWAEKLKFILGNPDKIREFGQAGREKIRLLCSPNSVRDELENIYLGMTGSS